MSQELIGVLLRRTSSSVTPLTDSYTVIAYSAVGSNSLDLDFKEFVR